MPERPGDPDRPGWERSGRSRFTLCWPSQKKTSPSAPIGAFSKSRYILLGSPNVGTVSRELARRCAMLRHAPGYGRIFLLKFNNPLHLKSAEADSAIIPIPVATSMEARQ